MLYRQPVVGQSRILVAPSKGKHAKIIMGEREIGEVHDQTLQLLVCFLHAVVGDNCLNAAIPPVRFAVALRGQFRRPLLRGFPFSQQPCLNGEFNSLDSTASGNSGVSKNRSRCRLKKRSDNCRVSVLKPCRAGTNA